MPPESARLLAPRGAVAVVFAVAATMASCHRTPGRGLDDVTTTTGTFPKPGSMPPPSRTVDAAGYVDNAGRSASADARTEMSGMRPTEAGGQRITGTPGSGLPLPIEPPSRPPPPGERPGEPAPGTEPGAHGTPLDAAVSGVTGAICEHEAYCGRTGNGRRWSSVVACLDDVRPRMRERLAGANCPWDFDVRAVAGCTSALRSTACGASIDELLSAPDCALARLCVAR